MRERRPASASLRGIATRSLAWVAADRIASRGISLVIFALLGRMLDASEFGLVAMAMTIALLSNRLTESGLGRAIVQRDSITSDHLSSAFWTNIALSMVFTAVLVVAAPFMEEFLDIDGLAPIMMALSVTIVIEAFGVVPSAVLEREFRFRALAVRRIASMFTGGATALIFAFAGAGAWSLVAQSVTSSLVGVVVLWTTLPWRPSWSFSFSASRELWHVGSHLTGVEILGYVSTQGDKLLIGAVIGPVGLGYYFFASRLMFMAYEFSIGILSRIALTTFSSLQPDPHRQTRVFLRFLSTSALINVPLFLILSAVSPVLLPYLFGDQWAYAVPVFQILCLFGTIDAVSGYDRLFLASVGRARSALMLTIAQTSFGLLLMALAVRFGLNWVAVAVVAGPYLFWPIRLITIKHVAGIPPAAYLGRWWRPMLGGTAAFGTIIVTNSLFPQLREFPLAYLAAATALGGLAYLVVMAAIARQELTDLLIDTAVGTRIAPLMAVMRGWFGHVPLS